MRWTRLDSRVPNESSKNRLQVAGRRVSRRISVGGKFCYLKVNRRCAALGTVTAFLGAATIAAGTGSAYAANDFTFGSGLAAASVVDYDIISGGASVNVYGGQATATFQDQAAEASASNVNVPLAGFLGALTVCSQAPPAPPLPAPATADTATNGNTKPVASTQSTGGGVVGVQSANATPAASASGQDDLATSTLPDVAVVQGGDSIAEVSANAGTELRSASATAQISDASLLGGALRLNGLKWQVQQSESGSDSRNDHRASSSTFSLTSISVGSVNIPVSSPAGVPSAIASANSLIAPLGLAIRLPTASSDAGSNNETLSPLTVAIGGDKALWGPILAKIFNDPNVAAIENAVSGELFDPTHCDELAGLLKQTGELNVYYNLLGEAAPIVIGILGQALSGSGEIDINLGGVSTSLDDTYYQPLGYGFAAPPLQTYLGMNTPAGLPLTGVPTSTYPSNLPTPGSATLAVPSSSPASKELPPKLVNAKTLCQTTSPAGQPGCSDGTALLGAAVSAIAVIGLLAADEVHRRRRRSALS